jgi:hypothetical protein
MRSAVLALLVDNKLDLISHSFKFALPHEVIGA